jgi:hypothetical protein
VPVRIDGLNDHQVVAEMHPVALKQPIAVTPASEGSHMFATGAGRLS